MEKTGQSQIARKTRKQLHGVIVSDKMKDTVVVSVKSYSKHPKYKKYLLRSKKFMAHDPGNVHKVGEKVTIEETAPVSRHKRFKVL